MGDNERMLFEYIHEIFILNLSAFYVFCFSLGQLRIIYMDIERN